MLRMKSTANRFARVRRFLAPWMVGIMGVTSFATAIGILLTASASGADPACTRADVEKARGKGRDRASRVDGMEAKLAECRGKLAADDEDYGLDYIIHQYLDAPKDEAACLKIVDRALKLAAPTARYRNSDFLGYCGGDCAKAPLPGDCQEGRARRERELHPKSAPEVEAEQPVACDLGKARKTVQNLDRAAFRRRRRSPRRARSRSPARRRSSTTTSRSEERLSARSRRKILAPTNVGLGQVWPSSGFMLSERAHARQHDDDCSAPHARTIELV